MARSVYAVQRPDDKKSPDGVHAGFRDDIEGLRAIAVLLVVFFHAGVPHFAGGYVGVDVFFVISGFLITSLLLRENVQSGTISFLRFYARRARRILPLAILVITAILCGSYFTQSFVTYAVVRKDARWATLFAANIRFSETGTNYFGKGGAPSPFQHFWSLAVEEQFYLVWPTIVLLTSRLSKPRPLRQRILAVAIVLSAASLGWSVYQTRVAPTWAYFSPATRAWELGFGAIVAAALPAVRRLPALVASSVAWLGIGAIVVSALFFGRRTAFPGFAALVPVLGAVGVIVGGTYSRGARAVVARRPLRSIGRVSYGWYLLHYPPMILLVGPLWSGPLPWKTNLLIAAGALGVAYALFALVERPVIKSTYLARRPRLSIAIAALGILVPLIVGGLLKPGVHHLLIH